MSTNPTSAAYFSSAEPYLKGNHRIALRAELVRELVGDPSGLRILDLGCGDGGVSLPLARDNDVVLVDNSQAMLDAAQRRAEALGVTRYLVQLADANSVKAADYDLVLALGLLAHVEDPEQVIAAIAAAMKPGGRAIIQLSDASRPLNRLGNLLLRLRGRDYRPTRAADIVALASRHGLKLEGQRSHLLILPGLPRLLGRALIPYDRAVRRRPRLADQGADTLLLFSRR